MWISARRVAQMLRVDQHRVPLVAQLNGVRALVIPGTHTRYSLEDVERVLSEAVRPTSASARHSEPASAAS